MDITDVSDTDTHCQWNTGHKNDNDSWRYAGMKTDER